MTEPPDGTFVALATKKVIATAGMNFMLSPCTHQRGLELGYRDGTVFYTLGRGGVLGDVDPDVVTAAFGFFAAPWVRERWQSGRQLRDPRQASALYAAECARWGEQNLVHSDDLARWCKLAEQLLDAVDPAGLPLFAAWRAEPRAAEGRGLAMLLIHLLREWRGGLHLLSTVALGRQMVRAALDDGGAKHAASHGWNEPWPAPSGGSWQQAEDLTDQLCAQVFDRVLSESERADFCDLLPVRR
ncbi:MAG: hypothetical protein M3Y42_14465 [Actinomycetota bacterium]|nr:hypothetical protein [Actinomycetota bacterium]MDQ2958154.1 hypothetical protein [Actinomycetota bacterium]